MYKEGCPRRLVVNQIDHRTNKMCKYLTDILNTLDERADSFCKNSKQLKEELETIEIDKNHIIGSRDIKQMFPMIPVEKTLQITRGQLDKDDTLPTRTEFRLLSF